MADARGMTEGARALAAAHREGRRTVEQTVEEVIGGLSEEPGAPVWLHVGSPDHLRARARALSDGSQDLPLLGVPFAVKDNIDVAGLTTSAACPDYSYRPERTAFVVDRLLAAGAILAGKTNMDQFATGLVGTRSPHGACSSVFSADHVSGGSSSGSAVAVARGLVAFSLGTDTAGSGRVPAAFNEIVGLKPTRGLVSNAGVVPACRTLDCVSIFAAEVDDAAAVLAACAAYDPADAFSRRRPRGGAPDLERGRPSVLGVPAPASLQFFGDEHAAEAWSRARARAERLADRIVEVDLAPFAEAATLLYDGPWLAERYAVLGEFLERDDVDADPVVRGIILAGAEPSAADAFGGQYRIAELRRHAEGLFAGIDALITPTAPTFPTHAEVAAEPVAANARLGTYTNFVNLLDLAAVAVPAGRRDDGLPFGVTLVGPAFSDEALVRLAGAWAGARAVEIDLVVAGAHLSGMPRNGELLDLGARLVRATRTAPSYRFFDLADGTGRPGLVRAEDGEAGGAVEVEVWRLDERAFGELVARVAPPLVIGSVELENGTTSKGFLCEAHALAHAREITGCGGWRAYSTAAVATP